MLLDEAGEQLQIVRGLVLLANAGLDQDFGLDCVGHVRGDNEVRLRTRVLDTQLEEVRVTQDLHSSCEVAAQLGEQVLGKVSDIPIWDEAGE
ncbi:Uncharacterised protein [Mycobacteroides abscessus subsp. abscessus]|nr:Uncharacterised protein [Mycobacteroides abscessus subsp. abscessus]